MERTGTTDPSGGSPLGGEIIRRVIRRESDALDTFFAHYFDRIYGYVVYLLGDPDLGQDVTQEAFLRMNRAIDRLDPSRDPSGWVFKIATNTVRDHWRSKRHKASRREMELDEAGAKQIRNGRAGPDAQLEAKESIEAVRSALETLSADDREVILLRDYEKLTPTEVAETLGVSPEAARQRHSRALSRLAKAYGRVVGKDR